MKTIHEANPDGLMRRAQRIKINPRRMKKCVCVCVCGVYVCVCVLYTSVYSISDDWNAMARARARAMAIYMALHTPTASILHTLVCEYTCT